MFCPVLLYAIYTASARHLTRLWHKQNAGRVVEFNGIPLPGLNDETAIHYHNRCISYLIEISNDPAQSYNEDALTAATILRFYEQIDTPLTGQDTETYLNVVRAVIETQQDDSFYSIRKIHGPVRDLDPYIPVAVSLRHSACLLALRQEIWSVLLYRRPLQLPICPNNDFELLTDTPPADDFVWANRIFVWTADVLKFCFGGLEIRKGDGDSNNPSPSLNVDSKSRVDHWSLLKRFEVTWQLQQPASYKPIFYRPASLAELRPFPEIWHNSDVQVLALQHKEIASLMLSVYDPRQPRLGLEALSAHRKLASQIRQATLKICGLAVSNKKCPATTAIAAVALSTCGSYFEESSIQEQDALVRFLEESEVEHAWPIASSVTALRDAWNEGTPRMINL